MERQYFYLHSGSGYGIYTANAGNKLQGTGIICNTEEQALSLITRLYDSDTYRNEMEAAQQRDFEEMEA